MALTKEERAEINRRNSQRSTGPSEEGKLRSRQNALKHGLRAEVLATPDEDSAAVAERVKEWEDYYQPDSPATKHLVAQCVQASLLSERCQRYHDAMVEMQFRDARTEWAEQTADEVSELAGLLDEAPAVAVRRLQETAAGARYLAERWEHLGHAFSRRGHWTEEELDEVIRLFGRRPEELNRSDNAWKVALCNLACHSERPRALWDMVTENVPAAFREHFASQPLPDEKPCGESLAGLCKERAAHYRAMEAKLFQDVDLPRLHQAQARALLIKDNKQAHLYLRYMAEARNLFQRSLSALVKLKKQGEPVFEGASEAPAAAEAVAAPNEANDDATPEPETISEASEAPAPAPSGPPEGSPEHEEVVMSLPVPSPAVSGAVPGPVLTRKSA
jgi:hypothetical protein